MAEVTGFLTTADGARLWYSLTGEERGGPVIAFADGLGCDGYAWQHLLPAFARDHRVLRFHYRGHGQSGVAHEPTRLGIHYSVDDLEQLLGELKLPPVVLVGHSMGVQVILEMHRSHLPRVRALVPLCGSYGRPLDTFHNGTELRTALPYLMAVVERWPRVVGAGWRRIVPTELGVLVGRFVEANHYLLTRKDFLPYLDHLAAMPPWVFARTLADAQEHTAEEHLPHIKVPTLVIGGEIDTFTPVRLSVHMAEMIPEAELLVIPRSSHSAPLEQPLLIELRLRRFLRERL